MSSAGGRDGGLPRPLFTVHLPPAPASVSEARRRLRVTLGEIGREDLVDDASLVVSEMVTNALLHAGSAIDVEASYADGSLLVRVSDASPHEPRLRTYGDEARTGRGLHLVESLTDAWGFERAEVGKTVWARISTVSSAGAEPATYDEASGLPTSGPEALRVLLLDVPQLLHAAWRQHAEAMLRDYLLATLGSQFDDDQDDDDQDDDSQDDDDQEGAGGHDPIQTHAEATDAIAVLDEHLPAVDAVLDDDRPLVDRQEPEVTLAGVSVTVPRASVPHFATLDRASDAAISMAEAGLLLTPPTIPEVRAFRRWVCGEVLRQAGGDDPRAWRMPTETSAPTPVPPEWDASVVTDADTPRLASDAEGRLLTVSRPAADLLGYGQEELTGVRLVAIIPERLRQAHLAGMSMYLLADRRPLIGQRVVLPALRRDGTELLVELLLSELDTHSEHPVVIADLRRMDAD